MTTANTLRREIFSISCETASPREVGRLYDVVFFLAEHAAKARENTIPRWGGTGVGRLDQAAIPL